MTQEDWKKAEEKCSGLFGRCTLRVDGRRVDIEKEPVKGNKLVLMVYIGGIFKGTWLSDACVERIYMNEGTRCLLKKEALNKITKNKKERERLLKQAEYKTYSPQFGSFRTLKSQYRKRFGDDKIELIEEE